MVIIYAKKRAAYAKEKNKKKPRKKAIDVNADTNKVKIQEAFNRHKAGNLQQAELLYKEILATSPNNVDANHLYGLLCRQVGKSDISITYIKKALSITPKFPEALNNLGNCYQDLDQFEKAIDCHKKALACKPDYAHQMNPCPLGNLLITTLFLRLFRSKLQIILTTDM